MALIYLVRHGRAAASYTDDSDPGLDDLGHEQATQAAAILKGFAPLKVLSSPLKRAQETAQPFAQMTGQAITIEDRLAEIPSPGLSLEDRGPWLQGVMSGVWSDQTEGLQKWREGIRECLLGIQENTVIFSHYVAINAAVSAATGDEQVRVFNPDNASITLFDNSDGQLKLVTRGDQAITTIN